MKFTVFYAWQSDLDSTINRSFIEKALKAALQKIDSDISIRASPRLDKDTAGVPGIPNIADTIFEKIKTCGIFVADMTFVGTTLDSRKLLPNANVLVELGLALGTVGWQRIILVSNIAQGDPKQLPFDLQHRRGPIPYDLKDRRDPSKKEIRRQLTADLQKAVSEIIRSGLLQSMGLSDLERISQERDQAHSRIKAGEFAELNAEHGVVVLSILPVNRQALSDEIWRDENFLSKYQPIWTSGWNREYSGAAFRTFSGREKREAVTEIRRDGTIIAGNNQLQIAGGRSFVGDPNLRVIPLWSIEGVLVDRIVLYLNLLREVGVEGPFLVDIAILNLEPTAVEKRLRDYGSGSARVFSGGDIVPDLVHIDQSAREYDSTSVALRLKPAFDFIWREFNFKCSARYTKEGVWAQ